MIVGVRELCKDRIYDYPRALNDEDDRGRVIIPTSTRTPRDAVGWSCIYERYILIARINSPSRRRRGMRGGEGRG